MYYIRKTSERWTVHNNATGKVRPLDEEEVRSLLNEFPNLQAHQPVSQSLTYFRNRIRSIGNLP
ncbi:MAG: hypothetical protein NW241_19365 [Bacteroidia bacterium]|jgi:hypothetical protein|nr:hypothetical protein [Bacteroidia bacterium]